MLQRELQRLVFIVYNTILFVQKEEQSLGNTSCGDNFDTTVKLYNVKNIIILVPTDASMRMWQQYSVGVK